MEPSAHNIDLNDIQHMIPKTLVCAYFFVQGVLALGCYFAIISVTDYINSKYPGFMFNFYADMPGNFA